MLVVAGAAVVGTPLQQRSLVGSAIAHRLAYSCGTPATTAGQPSGVSGQPAAPGSSLLPGVSKSSATRTTSAVVAAPADAYYLIQASGAVSGYAGAAVYGSQPSLTSTAVVGATSIPSGTGYWLLSSGGDLFSFGNAVSYGSPGAGHHVGAFTAVASTPDGNGYWVATSGGQVFGYGDARSYGSGAGVAGTPVVGIASSADGHGYWLAYADGAVRQFGDAPFYGSAAHLPHNFGVVSIAPSSGGDGYWLAASNGQIFSFGEARFQGSLLPDAPKAPDSVVAIVPTLATQAPPAATTTTTTEAASTTTRPKPAGAGRAPPVTTLAPLSPLRGDPFVHGAIGYDLSSFQCQKRHPGRAETHLPQRAGLAVLQVGGWLDSSLNSCLSSEQAWARRAARRGDPPALYLFVNSPTRSLASTRQAASGPAGLCARKRPAAQGPCRAYNYGFNGAVHALAYASSRGVRSSLWWLDVENASLGAGQYASFGAGHYWSSSQGLNDLTIEGAIDALRRQRVTPGIYSSSIQYAAIAGDYVPSGPRLPLWVAGVPWTRPPYGERGLPGPAILAAWCAGVARYRGSRRRDLFAGGVPWLLQETPGFLASPYGIDPDYAC